jgi:hypothetical protein
LIDLIRMSAVLHSVHPAQDVGGMCTLEVWNEVSSRGRRFIRCRITNDPPELPDGAYRVEFAGYRVVTNKLEGHWELSFLWPQTVSEFTDDLRGRGAA